MLDIVVIGSGIAGLAAARRLADAGRAPVILDKGRGIGGRVATRRAGALQFDHGAQYVTAKGDAFAAVLDRLAADDALAPWLALDGTGRRRVGRPGMTGLARGLAAGLDLRQGVEVTSLRPVARGWRIGTGPETLEAAQVIVTVPAPQIAALIGADHPLAGAVAPVRFDPCLTLMAATLGPEAPFVARSDAQDPLSWIAQDASKPGRAGGAAVTWVAQAGPDFSRAHLEDAPDAIAARMLPMLCDRLGLGADRVIHAVAHRWRFARVSQPLDQPFLAEAGGRLRLAGDWCLGARIEAAWTSGRAAADDLLERAP